MIDEKKLIEDIKEWGKEKEIKWTSESVISLLESAPKIGEWIPCSERLPENAEYEGAFCPTYNVMTKYGKTIGWYNPDFESWFVLIWFMTERYLTEEIDLKRGDVPKVVKAPLNSKVVIAWQPLPEEYVEESEGRNEAD